MKVKFHWHNYKYFPYEKDLARRELLSLTKTKPKLTKENIAVEAPNSWKDIAFRTTYFREAIAEDGTIIIPQQAHFELTANGVSESGDFGGSLSLNHQSTRYSAHGIHEFRGKYNPQIVRAIGNIVGIKPGDWIIDPFCGSGTTLLESAHTGWNAVGIELNPLGVEITNAKIASIKVPEDMLIAETTKLKENLKKKWNSYSFEKAFLKKQIDSLQKTSLDNIFLNWNYLKKWFSGSVLIQVASIVEEIKKLSLPDIQNIYKIFLSDILRHVSFQDPGDLRIRRRKHPAPNYPVIPLFVESISSKIKNIILARKFISDDKTYQKAILEDTRYISERINEHKMPKDSEIFDAAITSPPYATALPYIDTSRLSLTLLNFITSDIIHKTEKKLIGSREITEKERQSYYESIVTNRNKLPKECINLCRRLRNAVNFETDGFRRKNVPALLYKYFVDMQLTFKQMSNLLRLHAPYAIVIGMNRTTLGGKEFIINTPLLLTRLAEESGFSLEKKIRLNTYQRFDIHKLNSIRDEILLILRKT